MATYELASAATDLASNKVFCELVGNYSSKAEQLIDKLIENWESPSRFYHSVDNHLLPMLDQIDGLSVTERHRDILEIAAWFHDCIYDPKSADNEKNSMKFFYNTIPNYNKDAMAIAALIKLTADFDYAPSILTSNFARLDLDYLNNADARRIVRNEVLVLKEFQFVDYSLYKSKRLNILANLSRQRDCTDGRTIRQIVDYLGSHRPRIGIYPGSFDPFHVGHLSVLKEAEKLFDKVIIAIGINPEKRESTGGSARLSTVKKILPYHQVEFFSTFLHKYVAKKSEDADITVVRGFRSGYDIDYELTNLAFMRDMSDNVKMVFIAPQKEFDHVSSSALRLMSSFGDGESKKYIPEPYYPSM